MRRVLIKELAIESIIAKLKFFQGNQYRWVILCSKDSQQALLYWPLRLELFHNRESSVFLLHKLSVKLRLVARLQTFFE